MDKKAWKEAYAAWLEGFPWIWFCSLTFRPGIVEPKAWSCLRRWIREARNELGDQNFGFVAVREFGITNQNLHFHAVLMGLKKSDTEARVAWMCRWNKLAGDSQITNFTPNSGGILYILKNFDPNDANAIEFEIHDETQLQSQLVKK